MFILYLPETHDFIVLKIKFYWFSRKRKYLKSFRIEKEKSFLPRNKNQISIKILIYDNKHQAMTSFFGRKVILNPGFYIQTIIQVRGWKQRHIKVFKPWESCLLSILSENYYLRMFSGKWKRNPKKKNAWDLRNNGSNLRIQWKEIFRWHLCSRPENN